MKRHTLLLLLLLLNNVQADAAGTAPKSQRQSWYERALNHVNPDNKDFGAEWEERKRTFMVQLGNPYFLYGLGATGALVLLLTVAVVQYTSHRRALHVTAQSLTDVLRHDQHSREIAREAIRRYNEHVESCNQMIEANGDAPLSPDPAMTAELNRLRAALLATREETKGLRADNEQKSQMIAEMSLQLKKGNPAAAQIPLDFVRPDYVARINALEKQLAAEKQKNQRQKGTPVDAHRA